MKKNFDRRKSPIKQNLIRIFIKKIIDTNDQPVLARISRRLCFSA